MIIHVEHDLGFYQAHEPERAYDLFDGEAKAVGWFALLANGTVDLHIITLFSPDLQERMYVEVDYKPLAHLISWLFQQGVILDWSQVPDEHLPPGITR